MIIEDEIEETCATMRLSKDLVKAAATLDVHEVRYLVDAYYAFQEARKRGENQVRALSESGEPHAVIEWMVMATRNLEAQVRKTFTVYIKDKPLAQWAIDIRGIGPVLAAGLLAHIDVTRAETAGAVWRFAGLDPTQEWNKGEKRPWNASLKTLCWKIGESFVKVSGHPASLYGRLYRERKERDQARNERGEFAEQAAAVLRDKKFRKDTVARQCYEKGILPPGHIHARAKRYAVKIFLSHYWEKGRLLAGLPIPNPFPIAHMGHAHKIEVLE